MKIFLKNMVRGLIAFTFIMGSVAMAQTEPGTTIRPENIFPKKMDLVLEYNTGVKNPLEENSPFADIFSFNYEKREENKALFEPVFENNTVTLGVQFNIDMPAEENSVEPYVENENYYLTFQFSAENFQKLYEINQEVLKKETFLGSDIYFKGEYTDMFVTQLDGMLIATNKMGNLKLIIENYKKTTDILANNETFQKNWSKKLEGSFVNVYVNPGFIVNAEANDIEEAQEIMSGFMGMTSHEELFKALTSEFFSVRQDESGFDFAIGIEGDTQKLQTLNFPFNKTNFIPELYQTISGQNLIAYTEGNNLKYSFETLKKNLENNEIALEEMNNFLLEFKEETGIDLQNQILNVLENKYMIAVHKTEQIYPAFTFVADVKNKVNESSQTLNQINEQIKTMMAEQEKVSGTDLHSNSLEYINGTTFYKHSFDIAAMGESSEFKNLPKEKTVLDLYFAVNPQGLLVISTHPQLKDVYLKAGGLFDNAEFKESFSNLNREISGIFYLDIDVLGEYIQTMLSPVESEEIAQNIDDAFAPWHRLYMISYATENTSWTEGSLIVDTASMENLGKSIFTLFSLGIENTVYPMEPEMDSDYCVRNPEQCEDPVMPPNMNQAFCDVKQTDWFYNDVMDLKANGLIQGYNDGCFRPGNEVTRAEFIHMLMKVWKNNDTTKINVTAFEKEKAFNDVPAEGVWYAPSINLSAHFGYVKGFSDNTFRPNESISRAEAVQILFNMNSEVQHNATVEEFMQKMTFKDVKENDWFHKAVVGNLQAGIISGKTAEIFDPHGNLTRAEAAKIINKFDHFIYGAGPANTTGERIHQDYAQQYEGNESIDTEMSEINFLEIPLLEGAQIKTIKEQIGQSSVIVYQSAKSVNESCETQAKIITDNGWKVNPETLEPIKAKINDAETWVQLFEQNDLTLSLSCNQKEGQPTNVTITQSKQVAN